LRQQVGRRGDVLPGRAAVTGNVDQAIVAAGPEDALLVGRLAEGEDRAVALRAGVVTGDRAAGDFQLLRVVPGQVRADDLPAGAVVRRAVDVLRSGIDDVRVVRRPLDREGPLEALLLLLCAASHTVRLRPDGDVADLTRTRVPGEQPAVADARADAAGEHQPRFDRLDGDVARFSAAWLDP